MANQNMVKRSVTVATRLSPREKQIIRQTAARRGQKVAHMLYDLAMAEAKRQVFASSRSSDR